ncbi:MAG TPA: AMP-binding protein [Candidatus Sulfotelmatobacter sp.]|nr:AMP-binding protein [Candidatus Sulfotelmatobacter sp.]
MNESLISPTLGSLPSHVGEIWKYWAQKSPERLALLDSSGRWSCRQLQSAIEDTREFLCGAGIRPGDRVMLVCENSREFVALFFAAAEIGAWSVLANARLSPQEIDKIREHCGARRVFYTVHASPHAMRHAKRHGAELLTIAGMQEIGIGALDETVQAENPERERQENVVALIYTSGTSGQPKGVMLTHRNLVFMATHSAQIRAVGPEDRLLGVLPMSHAVGLAVVLLGTLVAGGSVYLMSRFDPPALLAALEHEGITILMGAPSMFALLVEYAKLKNRPQLEFSKLRVITSSGAPLQPTVKEETERVFGMVLHNGYGISECSPTIALTRIETPRNDTSVGRIFPEVEIRLVGPDGNEVAAGEVGELWIRGPNIMKGYYRAPEETAAAINAEGWFNSRDLARLEQDHLFIVGRTKELIVRYGFNVYPAEVEAILNACGGVARSAVIGNTAGNDEEILAFVELVPGSATSPDDIATHARKNLAPYKQPSKIVIVEEIPMTPTGKVAKNELAKRFLSGTAEQK